jgi:hypothetical protein
MDMKICAALLLLCIGIPLLAQADSKAGVFIHIVPITGEGSREDRAFILGLLAEEAKARNYVTISSPQAADYLLIGTVAPYIEAGNKNFSEWDYSEDEAAGGILSGWEADRTEAGGWEIDGWEYDGPGSGMYVFTVKLQDNVTKRILAEQDLIYRSLEDFVPVLPVVMSNIFSYPLVKPGEGEDAWRDKWLYAKAAAAWNPRVYYGQRESTYYLNFGGSIGAEFQFLDFMSTELNIEIAPDWILNTPTYQDKYLDLIMEIPLIIKYIFKPSRYFMIEPYAGIQFNISLFTNAIPPACSWLLGLQYGVKAGKGVIFVEPRIAGDIGSSSLNIPRIGIEIDAYRRFSIYLGIGYKYGFFTRNGK